tara:strand:+ start:591 stop:1760 length:1170 start_codon:yes stop_codon:yes gene_type:complete
MLITLFYKNLTKAGGAERLLLNQYHWLKDNNFKVKVVCFSYKNNLFLNKDSINLDDILVLKGSWLNSMYKLFLFLFRNKTEIVVASGVKEVFLASIITKNKYNLLLHHPLFMTINETDKFSIFLRNKFSTMCESNYGARIFYEHRKNLNFVQHIKINLKACLSILSIKSAKNIFVLSDYSKTEKRYLFNKKAIVCQGAIKKSAIEKIKSQTKDINSIICVSRLEQDKRIDILLKAFKKLLDTYPNKKLIICGTGSSEKDLKQLSKNLGISQSVIFTGFVSDAKMEELNRKAYLFVSLDWADYKITLFEALANLQRILVSSETSQIEDLEKTGHMTRVRPDVENSYMGMLKIFESESNLDAKSIKNFLEDYTWDMYNKKLFGQVLETNIQ